MSRAIEAELWVEDRAHEAFLAALVARIAAEEGVTLASRMRSARGGQAHALAEFKGYLTIADRSGAGAPDLLIVGVDGNCTTFARRRAEIRRATRKPLSDRLVVACPDPHVERWYLDDPVSFQTVVGRRPVVGKKKCRRDHYKNLLARAIGQAGHPPTLGGVDFAPQIVAAMDLYRAGRADRSLKAFVDDLRSKLRNR